MKLLSKFFICMYVLLHLSCSSMLFRHGAVKLHDDEFLQKKTIYMELISRLSDRSTIYNSRILSDFQFTRDYTNGIKKPIHLKFIMLAENSTDKLNEIMFMKIDDEKINFLITKCTYGLTSPQNSQHLTAKAAHDSTNLLHIMNSDESPVHDTADYKNTTLPDYNLTPSNYTLVPTSTTTTTKTSTESETTSSPSLHRENIIKGTMIITKDIEAKLAKCKKLLFRLYAGKQPITYSFSIMDIQAIQKFINATPESIKKSSTTIQPQKAANSNYRT